MKYKGFNARRDANEGVIVDALRAIGCKVIRLDKPLDLLVGYHGYNYLIEVKVEDGTLTPDQKEFIPTWRGQLAVVRTAAQAIDIVTRKHLANKVIFNDIGRG
tara:strand:- start:8143 stop:8451 length:309 start_codon:yes stop_codon:yes gene_type:complete